MPTSWQRTDLSVNPTSCQMADTDRTALSFAAGEPISGATAELVRIDTMAVVTGSIDGVAISANNVIIVVQNLTRDVSYELSIDSDHLDLSRWTKILMIDCVA